MELLKLIAENPELPVVPMVDTEVIGGDEFGYWMGEFGECKIAEYAIDEWVGDGIVRYKDDDTTEESLVESIATRKYDGSDEAYEKAKKEAPALWEKAIIVYINAV